MAISPLEPWADVGIKPLTCRNRPDHNRCVTEPRAAPFARCAGTVTSYELVNHGHCRRVYSIGGKRLVPDKAQSVADLGRTILVTLEVNLIIIGGNQWNHCLGS